MKRQRILAGILALTMCAVSMLSLVGCGSTGGGASQNNSGASQADRVDLVLWGAADDREMLGEMIEDFEEKHPEKDYNIEFRVTGEDVARDEALKDIEAAADVFAITNDQLGALVNANAVYENTVYAQEINETRTQSSIKAAMVGDKLYGYPSSAETYFLFYDKRLLSEDEVGSLESIMAKTHSEGVAPFGFDFSDAYFSSAFFLTTGCKVYGDDGQDPSTVTFNSENGVAAAKYIAWLKSKGAEDMDSDVAGSRFAAGKLAAYVSGDWKIEAYKDALGDNMGVAKLPTI
ncbi:MAG: extracellular solute-binding protein, partial [Clostridia bacterium]|nr:extracellular solute-binding protein [Clostridia bacterium]